MRKVTRMRGVHLLRRRSVRDIEPFFCSSSTDLRTAPHSFGASCHSSKPRLRALQQPRRLRCHQQGNCRAYPHLAAPHTGGFLLRCGSFTAALRAHNKRCTERFQTKLKLSIGNAIAILHCRLLPSQSLSDFIIYIVFYTDLRYSVGEICAQILDTFATEINGLTRRRERPATPHPRFDIGFLRRARKKPRSRATHSSSRTPPVTSNWWFRRPSA